jgi:hypothetical protein
VLRPFFAIANQFPNLTTASCGDDLYVDSCNATLCKVRNQFMKSFVAIKSIFILSMVVAASSLAYKASAQPATDSSGSFIGNVAPDLTPCLNGGFEKLASFVGLPFRSEEQCLEYAALGGTFTEPSPNSDEADFYVTNLTLQKKGDRVVGLNLQLDEIRSANTINADNVTVGTPSQWPAGTLPAPLSNPNWPAQGILKLKFDYSSPIIYGLSQIDWTLRLNGRPDVAIHIEDPDGPGWYIKCTSDVFKCTVKDYVHISLQSKEVTSP